MAIAFDSSAMGAAVAGGVGSGATWSHTCSGSNRLLIVAIGDVQALPTAVTYNGVAMTLIVQNGSSLVVYYLLNPSTGTNTVSITTTDLNYRGVSVSYTGVLQTSQPDSYSAINNYGTGGNVASGSTTVVAQGCWIIACGVAYYSAPTGISAGLTTRQTGSYDSTGSLCYINVQDSNGTVPTGAYSITFTSTGTANYTFGTTISISPVPTLVNGSFLPWFI